MTDQDLDNLYKLNINMSHPAALRGIFDAGVAIGQGQVQALANDPAATTSSTAAIADTPNITVP